MNQPLFTGLCTALVTPFFESKINFPMLEQLIRRQQQAGVSAIVLGGTTGEAPTLSDFEKIELFRHGKQYSGTDIKMIAGTGSNCTEHAVALSKAAEEAGADGLLVVSPYYNKATEEGLYAHYLSIAHAVSIPIILYNVPSRTGLDIPVSVYKRLANVPNIVGVKEASTDITKITRILSECGSSFYVWTGNDDMTVPVMSLGGKGVISVTGNIMPETLVAMCDAALDGDFDTAADLQKALLPLNELLFSQVNPIPVKAAMKLTGYDCGECRLPLTALSKENLIKLTHMLA